MLSSLGWQRPAVIPLTPSGQCKLSWGFLHSDIWKRKTNVHKNTGRPCPPDIVLMAKLNRDLMNTMPVKAAALASMTVIDALQDYTPEMQLVALTATYKLMTERYDVSPHDVFTVADNVMHHADGRRVEFKAIADYLEGEL